MEYIYIVNAGTQEWSETNEALKDIEHFKEFKNENPLIAREEAFKHSKSYEEIFLYSREIGADNFFNKNKEIEKRFTISISLVEPNTSKRVLVDIFEPLEESDIKNRYDLITMNWVLEGLQKELNILKQYNVPIGNKIKQIQVLNYQFSKKEKVIEVIPTVYIDSNTIRIPDLDELL